jgi:NADPH:quinone reductase-like Zn-dependent oxidoreductase
VAAAIADLPATMAKADRLSNTIERAVVDLAEAVILHGSEGETFDAIVTDDDEGLGHAKDVLGKDRARLAFNAVGGDSALRLMNLLGEGGIHITYGAMGRRPLTIPNGLLIFKDLQFRGLWVSRWVENAPPAEVAAVYGFLASEVAAGRLLQPVDSTYVLEDFTNAILRSMESGRAGKVIFELRHQPSF